MPLVSVIIPVYNTEEYLRRCIDSILSQTVSDIEIILINDGSTDNSYQVINSYAKNNNNIIVLSQENQGQSAARNKGIHIAKGKYIYFCDSDDYIDCDTLEQCINAAESKNVDVVMFDATDIYNNYDRSGILKEGRVYNGIQYLRDFYYANPFPSPCLYFFRRDLVNMNSICFLEGCYFEDNDFTCRLMAVADRVWYIPRKFYHRYYRPGSTTQSDYSEKKAVDYYCVAKSVSTIRQGDREINPLMCNIALKIASNGFSRMDELTRTPKFWDIFAEYIHLFVSIAGRWDMDCDKVMLQGYLDEAIDLHTQGRLPHKAYEAIKEYAFAYGLNQMHQFCDDPNLITGIYGKGKRTDYLLKLYGFLYGNPKAQIIYIDTFIESGIDSDGFVICNVHDIDDYKIDVIIIPSRLYGAEMKKKIVELYGDTIPMISMY